MGELHLVLTFYEQHGWGIESPQLPGMIGGRESLTETLAIAPSLCEAAGLDEFPTDHWVHVQFHVQDENGTEYIIRLCQSDDEDESDARYNLAERLNSGVLDGHYTADIRARQPIQVTGERLLVAALDSDTIGWCEDQLDHGAAAIFSTLRDEDEVWSLPLSSTGFTGQRSFPLEELGLSRESTIADAFEAVQSAELDELLQKGIESHPAPLPVTRSTRL